eukprot:gnl/TRDRNA2_/TRDRNA2_94411_c0_seq1.p1 gnl/TRDRNA2_/TRDRNA2_94411_c0~~gnl/TRDRNA2_/TRDRNA2_94411_c0_seq1.p1  ORF type:complete len:425 (+),score=56.52 gnl/TRDRNA2_/TRDRNA2_94411_c0_seq1:36-1277(+)
MSHEKRWLFWISLCAKLYAWQVLHRDWYKAIIIRINMDLIGCEDEADDDKADEPLVVIAGPGRVGTTSVIVAIERMGMKTFTGEDIFMFLPRLHQLHGPDANIDGEFYEELESIFGLFYLPHLISRGNSTSRSLQESLRDCGVKVAVTRPYNEFVLPLLRTDPNAKLIIMEGKWEEMSADRSRELAHQHLRSTIYDTILRFSEDYIMHRFCNHLPYRWLFPHMKRGISTLRGDVSSMVVYLCYYHHAAREHILASRHKSPTKVPGYFKLYDPKYDGDEMPGYFKLYDPKYDGDEMSENQTLYEVFMEELRTLVPAERQLSFDLKKGHGWKELAAFLGREPPPAGTPFPRLGSRCFTRSCLIISTWGVRTYLMFWLFLIVSAGVSFALFYLILEIPLRILSRIAKTFSVSAKLD